MKKERIFAFDIIRTIAISMIVIFHFFISDIPVKKDLILFGDSISNIGVTLFIILSGAAITYSITKQNKTKH